jgi:hypothetical protein
MKVNPDSIVFIIISLLILFISGLSKRRKKKPVMKSNLQFKQPITPGYKGKDLFDAVRMINDPLDKLEKMFSTPQETDMQEGTSLEVVKDVEQGPAEVSTFKKTVLEEVPTGKEAQSLEVIVDEVAEYLKEKEIEKSAIKSERKFDDLDLTKQGSTGSIGSDQKKRNKIPLFENVDEIKKALIYSEILKRKEY